VHRARERVELGVVLARRVVDRLRIGRELVPEPVEVDALAARDQPLDIGASESALSIFRASITAAMSTACFVFSYPPSG
jgi:hypothetical protein